MREDLIVHVERLARSEITGAGQGVEVLSRPSKMAGSSSSSCEEMNKENVVLEVENENNSAEADAPLIRKSECRICQDEDGVKNLETPCACSGSLKYAHRTCVQHWCNEKGDINRDICHQPYQPCYVAPPQFAPVETVIDIGSGWHIAGTPINFHDPRLLAIAEAEIQFMESDYDSYNETNAGGVEFCHLAALYLMALLLMRHAASMTDEEDDDNSSAVFSLFLLRIIGFLFACYIMVWATTFLQCRKQRQQAAVLARTPFAFVVQSGENRGIHLAIATPAPAPMPGAMPSLIPVPAVASISTPRLQQV